MNKHHQNVLLMSLICSALLLVTVFVVKGCSGNSGGNSTGNSAETPKGAENPPKPPGNPG